MVWYDYKLRTVGGTGAGAVRFVRSTVTVRDAQTAAVPALRVNGSPVAVLIPDADGVLEFQAEDAPAVIPTMLGQNYGVVQSEQLKQNQAAFSGDLEATVENKLDVMVLAGEIASPAQVAGKVGKGDLVVNASDYGFSTAGTTAANAAALTAAMTAAAGRPVLLRAGTYELPAITLTGPVVGEGDATVLHAGTVTIGASGVTLSDVKVQAKSGTAIVVANKTDLSLDRVHIDHDGGVTGHLGVDAFNVTRLAVRGGRFHVGGVQLSGCADFLIHGNHFDCGYANVNEPIHASAQSSGVISNNTITQTSTDGIDLFSSGEYCVISGNRLIGLRGASGIEAKVTMSDTPGNSSATGNVVDGVVIIGNVLRDFQATTTGTRCGIYAEYVDSRAVPAFAVAETNRAVVIVGNVVEDMAPAAPAGGVVLHYWGIAFTGHNGLIADNVIHNLRQWNSSVNVGIRLAQSTGSKCVGVRVAGNIVAGIESGAGIEVGTLDQCQIDNNIVRGSEVTTTQTRFGVTIAAGGVVSDSSVSGNTFECNYSTGMGLRGANSTAQVVRGRVHSNTFKHCGVSLPVAQHTSFVGNVVENATNSQAFSVGVSGTSCRGNTYHGTHILMSADYGLVLTDHDGFVVSGSSFRDTNRGLLLVGGTRKGLVTGNLSINQSGGTELPHYSGVSGGDQATIVSTNNLVTT